MKYKQKVIRSLISSSGRETQEFYDGKGMMMIIVQIKQHRLGKKRNG